MKRITLLVLAAVLLNACKKEVKKDGTARPADSTEMKLSTTDSIDCAVSMTEMYDAQGSLATKSVSIILPKLKAGKQYNIHAMYNVSSGGQNKVLIHLTDTQNTLPQSSVQTTVTFPCALKSIKETPGAEPIDPTKDICIGIFHENYEPYFIPIQQHAAHIFEATQNRTACDEMSYQELFENMVPINNGAQGGPKKCGDGKIIVQ